MLRKVRFRYNLPMDHDRLFKELLSHFFVEFVDLFFPELGQYLDREAAIVSLDKEVFTDVTLGETHEVDLLMKARVRGEDAFFLIHVENQSTAQSEFPKRMFRYFARLTEKYDLPVYPVVVFSYDSRSAGSRPAMRSAFRGERCYASNMRSFSSTACRGVDLSARIIRWLVL